MSHNIVSPGIESDGVKCYNAIKLINFSIAIRIVVTRGTCSRNLESMLPERCTAYAVHLDVKEKTSPNVNIASSIACHGDTKIRNIKGSQSIN